MQDGDLSNEVEARLLVVIEGLVVRLLPDYARKERALVIARQWKRAAKQWAVDEVVVSRLWDLAWRGGWKLDGATFLSEPYAEAMAQRFDDLNIPLNRIRSFRSAEELAYQLNFMPDVASVYFSEPPRPFLFGGRGQFVEQPGQLVVW